VFSVRFRAVPGPDQVKLTARSRRSSSTSYVRREIRSLRRSSRRVAREGRRLLRVRAARDVSRAGNLQPRSQGLSDIGTSSGRKRTLRLAGTDLGSVNRAGESEAAIGIKSRLSGQRGLGWESSIDRAVGCVKYRWGWIPLDEGVE
jgi:hypothetical protein